MLRRDSNRMIALLGQIRIANQRIRSDNLVGLYR
jgi:hypothetical protein